MHTEICAQYTYDCNNSANIQYMLGLSFTV